MLKQKPLASISTMMSDSQLVLVHPHYSRLTARCRSVDSAQMFRYYSLMLTFNVV